MKEWESLWNSIFSSVVRILDSHDPDIGVTRYTFVHELVIRYLETDENLEFSKPWTAMNGCLGSLVVAGKLEEDNSGSQVLEASGRHHLPNSYNCKLETEQIEIEATKIRNSE